MVCDVYTTVYGSSTELKCITHGLIKVFEKAEKRDSAAYNKELKKLSDAHKAEHK